MSNKGIYRNIPIGRVTWVDIAKGVGIILVVLGHNKCPMGREIFSFHMPLFFILSGFFLKDSEFCVFLYKRFRTLIVPCAFFWAISFICATPLLYLRNRSLFFERLSDHTLFYFITVNPPLWFLIALWWALIASFIIIYVISPRKRGGQLFISLICFTLGYILAKKGLYLFYITHGLIATPFVVIGRIYYQYKDKINKKVILISAVLGFLLSYHYFKPIVNLSILELPSNPFAYLLPSLSGSFMIISICYFIGNLSKVKFLSYLGALSLFIMALHGNVEPFIRPLHNYITNNWIYSLLATFIECSLSFYLGLFLMNKFPLLFSYKKNEKT